MNKQTAVEWLAEQMMHPQNHNPYIEQALAMEREQIIDAVSKGFDNCEEGKVRWLGEEYYNETYKGGDNETCNN